MQKPQVLQDLAQLKHLTQARIGLPRAGTSLSAAEVLKFDLDHAKARDAVHLPFQTAALKHQLEPLECEILELHSAAADRLTYLQRPDLGRKLSSLSRETLPRVGQPVDICLVAGDRLSSTAIHQNAATFLQVLYPKLKQKNFQLSSLHLVHQARVALADEIGEHYRARISVILIGERPGLSAADSMGIYMTYAPKVGRTDAERNCISNIRQGGLSYNAAADQLLQLISGALQNQLSGVDLKIQSDAEAWVESEVSPRLNDCDSR